MNKYEQLVEFIINDENDKARELFHTIVVEKSRDIYESLVSEDDLEETIGGNEVEDLVDEVTLDEEGINEEEHEEGEEGFDYDADGEQDEHEGDHEEIEDRVVDLEDALNELKAEFDALMSNDGELDAEDEEEFVGDVDGEEPGMDVEMMEAESCDDEDEEAEEVDETIVREYVEKVATPSNTEGADNKTSIVAKKNDMGGSSANIAKGGEEKGAGKVSPKGTLVNDPLNKPGANAGKAFAKKETAKTKEEGGVEKQSPLAK